MPVIESILEPQPVDEDIQTGERELVVIHSTIPRDGVGLHQKVERSEDE